MSDTASLDLSKTLYELSGWWPENIPVADDEGHVQELSFPPYDTGYLLRKLPRQETKQHDSTEDFYSLLITWEPEIEKWKAGYKRDTDNYWQLHKSVADTPEDALAKLAIQLFKEGILPISGRD